MSEVRTTPMWHVYGLAVPDGHFLAGCWFTMMIKPQVPQEMPPSMPIDWKDFGVREGATTKRTAVQAPYLASFDHKPTDEEMDALQERFDPDFG